MPLTHSPSPALFLIPALGQVLGGARPAAVVGDTGAADAVCFGSRAGRDDRPQRSVKHGDTDAHNDRLLWQQQPVVLAFHYVRRKQQSLAHTHPGTLCDTQLPKFGSTRSVLDNTKHACSTCIYDTTQGALRASLPHTLGGRERGARPPLLLCSPVGETRPRNTPSTAGVWVRGMHRHLCTVV